jgi:hypothetical protein
LLVYGAAIGLAVALLACGCHPPVAPPVVEELPPPPVPDTEETWLLRERLAPTAQWVGPAADVLGFVAAAPWPSADHSTLRLGWWDLQTGTVAFDPEPALVIADATPPPYLWLSWDPQGTLCLAVGREAEVESVRPDLSLVVVSPPALALPPWNGIVFGGETDALVLTSTAVEVLREPGAVPVLSYPLERPGRPLDLRRREGVIEAMLSVPSQPGSTSLSAGLYVLDEAGMRLQALSPLFPVNEAGPGTRWARAGNRVFVATPAGEIWTWELGGDVVLDEALTELLANYRREHAPLVESPTPPALFGWGDLLVVLDRPHAVEELRDASGQVVGRQSASTWYVVAVRDGVVLGEIVSRAETLTTRRDGVVTQSVALPDGYDCFWWFPGQCCPP